MGNLVLNGQTVLTQVGTNTPVMNNSVLNKSLTELDINSLQGPNSNADNTSLPLFGCRAFVCWSGRTYTNINGEDLCDIESSGNVSKVVRTTTGTYQIYFATSMPDANYAVLHCLADGSNNFGPGGQIGTYTSVWADTRPANKLAESLVMQFRYPHNNTAYDVHDCNLVIFR